MKDAGGDNHAFQASNFKCKDKSRSYSYHLRPTCGWKLAEMFALEQCFIFPIFTFFCKIRKTYATTVKPNRLKCLGMFGKI